MKITSENFKGIKLTQECALFDGIIIGITQRC
jgi:hypothetical protein